MKGRSRVVVVVVVVDLDLLPGKKGCRTAAAEASIGRAKERLKGSGAGTLV